MALGELNLMDLDVDDVGTLEHFISNPGGGLPPVAVETPPVVVPPVAPAAPVPPAPVTPPAVPVVTPPAPEPAPAVPGSGPTPEPPAPPVAPAEPAPVTTPPVEPPANPMAEVKPRYYTRQWSDLNKLSAHIMATNPDMTPSQAEARARQDLNMEPLQVGAAPVAPAPGAPAPAPTPPPVVRTTATVEAEMQDIESRYLTAVEAEGGLVTGEAARLQLEYSRKASELQHLQAQEATALAALDEQATTARRESLQRAYAMHPDAQKPETAVGQAVAKVMADLEANDDPRLDDPRAPELVVQLALLEVGAAPVAIAPVAPAHAPAPAAPAPTPPTPPVTPQQRTAQPPVLPGHGSTVGGAQPTLQDLNGTLAEFFNQEGGDPFGSLLYPHLAQGQQPPRLIL